MSDVVSALLSIIPNDCLQTEISHGQIEKMKKKIPQLSFSNKIQENLSVLTFFRIIASFEILCTSTPGIVVNKWIILQVYILLFYQYLSKLNKKNQH